MTNKLVDPKTFEFHFGKWKGLSYDEVKREDPGYLMWCHDNIEWFELTCEEVDDLEDLLQGDDLRADGYRTG